LEDGGSDENQGKGPETSSGLSLENFNVKSLFEEAKTAKEPMDSCHNFANFGEENLKESLDSSTSQQSPEAGQAENLQLENSELMEEPSEEEEYTDLTAETLAYEDAARTEDFTTMQERADEPKEEKKRKRGQDTQGKVRRFQINLKLTETQEIQERRRGRS